MKAPADETDLTAIPPGDVPKLVALVMLLRSNGITDPAVLAAIERTPRRLFLPSALASRAYQDVALPIGHGQAISQPLVVAKMTESLALEPHHTVFEVGTGSGYQAAVLARLSRMVFTVERHRPLLKLARERFSALGLDNIAARVGDGQLGWPGRDSFDRVILTAGGGTEPPPALVERLAIGGRMIAPLADPGDPQALRLVLFVKYRHGLEAEVGWPVRFVPLLSGIANETESA